MNNRILSAVNLTIGAIEIGIPSASLHHHFFSHGLTVGPPDIGAPTFGNNLPSANDLVVGSPFIEVGRLTINYPTYMRLGSQLLYRAATGFEKSMADVDSDRITALQAELVNEIWNPVKCPTTLLPYLAWAMGVEYWNDNWSETTKRAWIASQWEFKARRGTRAGLKMAVDYAGRDVSWRGYNVTKITTRPQQVFSGPSLSKAERESWMSRLPQIRAWRINEAGEAGANKAFLGGNGSLRQRSYRFCLGGRMASVDLEVGSPEIGTPEMTVN